MMGSAHVLYYLNAGHCGPNIRNNSTQLASLETTKSSRVNLFGIKIIQVGALKTRSPNSSKDEIN